MTSEDNFTLKILHLPPTIQLDSLIVKFLKALHLKSTDLDLIRSTNDSEVNYNYINFFASEKNLKSFLDFLETSNLLDSSIEDFKYEIITSEAELNSQLPGHLFIKNLSLNLTAQDLYNIFKPYGEISTCKIIFNEFNISKGFGFINFANKNQSEEAIRELNGKEIDGFKIFINYHISKKDRLKDLEYRKSNFSNIYIKNLPLNYPKKKLKKLFEKFGDIESIILPQAQQKISADSIENEEEQLATRGYGFINFKYHEDAASALEALNNFEIEPGMKLQIDKAEHKKERFQFESLNSHFSNHSTKGLDSNSAHTSTEDFNEESVANLSGHNRSSSSFQYMNSSLSSPDSISFPQNLNSPEQINHSIQYASSNQTRMAQIPQLPMVPPFLIGPDSNIISTATGLPIAGPQFQDSNLYICHIPIDYKDEDLKSLFDIFGQIVSAKVITWQEDEIKEQESQQQEKGNEEHFEVGMGKGFGFVCFSSPLDASKALVNMNGYRLDSKHILQVSFAQRKETKFEQGKKHHYIQNHLGGLYRYIGGMYSNNNTTAPPPPPSLAGAPGAMMSLPMTPMGTIAHMTHMGPVGHMYSTPIPIPMQQANIPVSYMTRKSSVNKQIPRKS